MKLIEKIFSVRNDERKTHKIITVSGIKIKVKQNSIKTLKKLIEDWKIMHDPSLYTGIPDDITLQLMFNNDCNCRCKFCSANNQTKQARIVMPKKWLYEYFEPIYKKTKNISPCYGEITLGTEGYEYLSYISENYPHIHIFTESNGILFDKKWRELASENLFSTHFSVNSVDEESFKKTVWDKDGVFPVIKRNIGQFINTLDEKGLSAFRPSISSVLNSTNYQNVTAFVKMCLEWKVQKIVFFFDTRENNIKKQYVKDKENFDKALITMLEIEKLLKDKVYLGFRLFIPVSIAGYEEIVNKTSMESLKEKYKDIWELAKDLDLKETYLKRAEAYKAKNKKIVTYYEFLTGITYHQKIYNGKVICENAWNHIRLRPDGRLDVCAWRGYQNGYKIQNFIENDSINFEKLFNDLYRRKMRKNFQNGCYNTPPRPCMKNCPGAKAVTAEEFNKNYNINWK